MTEQSFVIYMRSNRRRWSRLLIWRASLIRMRGGSQILYWRNQTLRSYIYVHATKDTYCVSENWTGHRSLSVKMVKARIYKSLLLNIYMKVNIVFYYCDFNVRCNTTKKQIKLIVRKSFVCQLATAKARSLTESAFPVNLGMTRWGKKNWGLKTWHWVRLTALSHYNFRTRNKHSHKLTCGDKLAFSPLINKATPVASPIPRCVCIRLCTQ